MRQPKQIFIELAMFLASFVIGALFMGHFLAKARDLDDPVDRLLQSGTGVEWMQLSMAEKREVCEEVARRFQTDEPKVTVVYYFLYLEGMFGQPNTRDKFISDMFIEAEILKLKSKASIKQQAKPENPSEIPDSIMCKSFERGSYIG